MRTRIPLLLSAACIATSQWDAVKLNSYITLSDTFLILALVTIIIGAGGRIRPHLPVALWIGLLIAFLSVAITQIFPPTLDYIQSRHSPLNVYNLVTTVVVHDSTSANVIKFILAYVGIPVLIAVAGKTHKSLVRLLDGWVIGAALTALVGLSDASHLTHISFSILGFGFSNRIAGLNTSPNTLAEVAAMALPACIIWSRQSEGRRRIAPFLFVGMGVALLLTGSRGGFGGALIGLIVCAVYDNSLRRKVPVAASVVATMLVIVVVFIPSVTNSVLATLRLNSNNTGAATSDLVRQQVAAQATTDFAHSPIHGVGLFAIQEGHQVELELLAAGGIILLIGWLFYVYGAIEMLPRIKRDSQYRSWTPLAGSIVAWLALGLTENETLPRYLLVPIGFACAAGYLCRKRRSAISMPGNSSSQQLALARRDE